MIIAQVLNEIYIFITGRVNSEKNIPLCFFVFVEARVVEIFTKFVSFFSLSAEHFPCVFFYSNK